MSNVIISIKGSQSNGKATDEMELVTEGKLVRRGE